MVKDRGRRGSAIALGLCLILSIVIGPVSPASARQAASPDAVDLAALTLVPADLAEPGFLHDGAFSQPLEEIAVNLAVYRGGPPADIQNQLESAGWTRHYVSILRLPVDGSNGQFSRTVSSYITEYQDPAGAARGFDVTEDEESVASATDLPVSRPIGERSEITRDRGVSGVSGQSFVSLDLTFQLGRFTAGVTDYQFESSGSPSATPLATPSTAPDTATVEQLAGLLAARLDGAGNDPGLSNAILRLAGEDATYTTYDDAYYRLDGEEIPLLVESTAAAEARTTSYGPATDVYQLWQGVDAAESGGALYAATLFRFPTAADGTAWLATAPDALAKNPAYPRLQLVANGPTLGDESILLTFTPRGIDPRLQGTMVIARVDTVVLRVHVAPTGNMDIGALTVAKALATAQVSCLRTGVCESISLPPG